MDFNDYQAEAVKTAIYPGSETIYKNGSSTVVESMYLGLGCAGEAGEVADCVKKWYRDGALDEDKLFKEMGDVLWYLAVLAETQGWTLEGIAQTNIDKLASRYSRGTLSGSGDDR